MSEKKSGSILGATFLITSSCIGAGMLALPVISGFCGFFPSIFVFLFAWFLMTSTALLLVEITGWFHHKKNLSTMIESLLGKFYRALCFILYLFLFYSLLVAYIALSGKHFSEILLSLFSMNISNWSSSCIFVAIFSSIIYAGLKPVDMFNRFLLIFKISSFVGLIILLMQYIKIDRILYTNIKYTLFPIPILITSFGYHNMIPIISNYLGGDIPRIRKSIIYGSLTTLFIYLIWIFTTLGVVSLYGKTSLSSIYKEGGDVLLSIKALYPSLNLVATLLAFSSILTSFLAQSISVCHFLSDALKIDDKKHSPVSMVLLTLLPPLLIALTYPKIFYKALDFVGLITILIFCIFPIAMTYSGRYNKNHKGRHQISGGKISLAILFFLSLSILIYGVLEKIGLDIFPKP